MYRIIEIEDQQELKLIVDLLERLEEDYKLNRKTEKHADELIVSDKVVRTVLLKNPEDYPVASSMIDFLVYLSSIRVNIQLHNIPPINKDRRFDTVHEADAEAVAILNLVLGDNIKLLENPRKKEKIEKAISTQFLRTLRNVKISI